MVKVNGTSLIDRILTQLSLLDLSKVIIVIGYKGDLLRNYISIIKKMFQGQVKRGKL